MKQKNQGKSPLLISLATLFAISFLALAEEGEEEAVFVLLGFVIMLLPVLVIFLLLKSRQKSSATHTHDRIDHSGDLKINPATGKAAPMRTTPTHSSQEHWLAQVETLYKNGTIDRREYHALRNRKF